MKRVLLIDDDRGLRDLLSTVLSVAGWDVFTAEDGIQGLECARLEKPELILCDLRMPRCNGFHVCRSIREKPDVFGAPFIIVTTGSSFASDRAAALESGADACLIKPFKPVELLDLIAQRASGGPVEPAGQALADQSASTPPEPRDSDGSAVVHPYLKFWGVRGSLPCPGSSTLHYGGNTACVEVRADGEIIILDAGTGIRGLGQSLVREFGERPISATILISHTHWDHIQGFPFFSPAYLPQNRITLMGFEGAKKALEATIIGQMESTYFPISLQEMPGTITIREVNQMTNEMNVSIGSVRVSAMFLNHPGVCAGYRLETSAGSIAYISDNEPYQRMRPKPDQDLNEFLNFANSEDCKLIDFVGGVDVLVVDAQYNDAEYQSRRGWGHGCVDDIVALAMLARAKHLYLFHHDPDHDDSEISRMVEWARKQVAIHRESLQVDGAREGLIHPLHPNPPVTGPRIS